MRHRYGLVLLLLLAPATVRAEEAPEQLLPAGAQFYVRWDGIEPHRAAYSRTALGKIMQGDTGTMVQSLYKQAREGLGSVLTIQPILRGASPKQLQKVQADAAEAAKLLAVLAQNGFLLAVEVRGLDPVLFVKGQVILVLPDAGPRPDPLFGAIRLVARLAQTEIKETKVDGRAVSYIPLGPASLAWWVEGKHAVLTVGTGKPEALVAALHKGDRLTSNPLYKRLAAFKQFETSTRGFLDAAALVKLGGGRNKDVDRLLKDMGLDNLRSLVFYQGFQGNADRGLVEIEAAGPRRGLLGLVSGKPFRLGDVPPLPPDVVSWSASNFDTGALYDLAFKAVEDVVRLVSPENAAAVQGFAQQANTALGVDLRKDLLGSLGDRMVQYNAPSEGPLALGQTFLFTVKDAKKLEASLEQAIQGIATLLGKEIRVKKRTYHGAAVREVHVRQQGFFFVPTYTIHKGWFVLSFFPQQVHGYVLRQEGKLRAWKPSPVVQASLDKLPREFISVSYSDPRPTVKQVLSIAPIIGGLVDSFAPEVHFDVANLPNTQDVTRHLFPNVSVGTDDGKTLRMESRDSLALPFDLSGVDAYFFLGLLSAARFAI